MVPGWFWMVLANVEGARVPRIVLYDSQAHNYEVFMMRRLPQLELGFENGPFECLGGLKCRLNFSDLNFLVWDFFQS